MCICNKLHRITNSEEVKRFRFENGQLPEGIPQNGIYILFEEGEIAHEVDGIVRIGINRENENLSRRLNCHFVNTNHNSSIFIKHMGRCIINKEGDPESYMEIWNKGGRRNIDYENKIKKEISKYIQKNFSFVIIDANNKEKRAVFEKKIIATVNHCNDCCPSEHWLGKHAPDKQKNIRISGLWQTQGLNGEQLNEDDLRLIENNLIKLNEYM